MPDTSSSQSPTPALLRFRGLDLEAMTALQMRNIDAVRRMANLMLDSTQEITERQAAFLKAGADQMNATFERGEGASDHNIKRMLKPDAAAVLARMRPRMRLTFLRRKTARNRQQNAPARPRRPARRKNSCRWGP